VRQVIATALAVTAAALAGCGGGTVDSKSTPAPPPKPDDTTAGAAVIRGWTEAMYKGDYDRAARYFASDALVQQVETIVLRTHEDAVAFGRSLPCRAKVTSIKQEKNGVLLATFDLFPGVSGTCPDGGNARVRFFIRRGKIETFHQLPDRPTPPGQSS
jgi:hypothetical protein